MDRLRAGAWLFLMGSLWGLNELLAGGFLYSQQVPLASVWLSAMALFLLAVSRAVVDRPGFSTVLGGLACLYRLVNAAPFFCHLLGIFLVGLAFDLAASIGKTSTARKERKLPLVGIAAAYGSNLLFALIATYIIRYPFWTGGGVVKVLDHIFVSGSLTAVLAFFLVPTGFRLGKKGESFFLRQSRWSLGGLLLAILFLWIAGRISG